MNYNDYINFKWGSEPQGNIKRTSLAKKWMFIKPDVGNLSPSPQVPFSSFAIIPYFGGYPTGYSLYEYCAWSTPKKLSDNKLFGFTHFCFSGCGDLHHFHNYFLIKPSKYKCELIKENYALNGLDIETSIYQIKARINNRSAYYKIVSKEDVVILPGFNGLNTEKYQSSVIKVNIKKNNDIINVDADYKFIHLYWSIKILNGEIKDISSSEITLSNNVEFILSFSIESIDDANECLLPFKHSVATKMWEDVFNVFNVNGEEKYKKLFYTSLMFALKKPYIYDKNHVYDFATMWDIYKTLLPFIFLFYKKEASIIANNMLKLVNKDGLFYHVNLFSSFPTSLSDQAICLINISLSTACLYDVDFDQELAKVLQKKEIEYYLNNLDKLDRTTYLLDLSDAIVAYYNAYHIDLGLDKVKELINKAYESDKVYLNKEATYYEGNYSNYSFRVSSSTIYRLDNKKEISKALDDFFGFKGVNSIRFKKPTHPSIVKWYMKECKRFEGLNNEPDMESMYLYSYLNEYDKQNKVIYDVINNSFSLKNNGVPGNDDNGGLSSWLAFNLLGLFPVVGTDKIKVGLPFFDDAKANNLTIKKHYKHFDSYVVEKVYFNGELIESKEITANDINKGGVLDIYLK